MPNSPLRLCDPTYAARGQNPRHHFTLEGDVEVVGHRRVIFGVERFDQDRRGEQRLLGADRLVGDQVEVAASLIRIGERP
jgi:hypothetical protein